MNKLIRAKAKMMERKIRKLYDQTEMIMMSVEKLKAQCDELAIALKYFQEEER